ncbi:OmpA family protein [Paraglaciecola arctica]|uniref:OmpA/MotB domain-containing protein n=1 Tax=Paraglaciecola arctica BSs20135 TaxID=493475 RepID=K6YPP4_9ALTE|nr:OmpA family protein [Paraglaciecola arctica]GAC18613.1 OmpA/MotB domain-containing protein [Paraglaciecola arctica BSs20135]
MKTKLNMNKLVLIKAFSIKKSAGLICAAMLLSACAGNSIVKLESSVEQLQDLNDHDRDGVIEARDKCAETVLGATIDNYGCGAQTTIVEPFKVDIKFTNNSYEIPPSALPKIQKLASFLEKNTTLQVLIEGHTSKVGSAELNQILSINRAKAVESILVNDFNIANERVSSQGYGFQRLADLADTETAHANNRRIMAELSKTVQVNDMIWTIYTVDQAI